MNLKAALKYQEMGFSTIPIKTDKKPYLMTWAEYQEKLPTVSQIKKWWTTWPDANIGIVTGKISNIDVVDCDSEAGRDALNEFLPDTLVMPISKTPKGWHYFFKHSPGLSNGVRVITDCDVRTTGGYIIVPPSKNGDGQSYLWMPGLRITEVEPAIMPDMLFSVLQDARQANSSERNIKNGISLYNKKIPSTYRKMLPAERKAIKILSDNPDMTNAQIGKELKRLGHVKDAGYVMKRLKYSELLRENLSKVRQHNAEVFSRCIVPRAIKEHETALKDKKMDRKDKFKYVKLALDKEFGSEDKRPSPPPTIKINKIQNLMLQMQEGVKEISDNGDFVDAELNTETDTI